jgi:hypothetical protein
VSGLQRQHKAAQTSTVLRAEASQFSAKALISDSSPLHSKNLLRTLPFSMLCRKATWQLTRVEAQPLRAFGACSSINGVPGDGPSCHNALRINRRGKRPGLRGPGASFYGGSDRSWRLAPVSDDSIDSLPGDSHSDGSQAPGNDKVLRFWQAGHYNPPRLARSSRDLSFGSDLAVKGDALIHRPCLVAGLVGSEWRTRRPV